MPSLTTAAWPFQPIPEPVKALLAKFYACVDAPQDPNSNSILANEVFHPDATFQINKRIIRGREEIAHWRDGAASGGGGVATSTHTVHNVYSLSTEGWEVLTTGTLALEMGDGRKAESEFACRCLVTDEGAEGERIKEWRGWVDYVPFLKEDSFEKGRVYDSGGDRA
nr:hypothetical protein B0A51_00276 [Rachicladosporium sp. CCFEE 5018]